jgi:hypothetical protein
MALSLSRDLTLSPGTYTGNLFVYLDLLAQHAGTVLLHAFSVPCTTGETANTACQHNRNRAGNHVEPYM